MLAGEFLMQHGAQFNRKFFDDLERLHPQFRLFAGEFATGKTAGITGVIHDPYPHVTALGLINKIAEERKILRRQVSKGHVKAGLNRHGLKAEIFQCIQIALHLRNADVAVQSVIGFRTVLRRRRLPTRCNFSGGEVLQMLPRLLGGQGKARHQQSEGNNCSVPEFHSKSPEIVQVTKTNGSHCIREQASCENVIIWCELVKAARNESTLRSL